ncbi:reverse transcriptase domain-containing protein [Tanacetum coccineum]
MPPRRNMNINDVYERIMARIRERLDQFIDQFANRMNDMMNPRRREDRNSQRNEDEELENPFFEGDVYDTDIEDVIEEGEGFVGKRGFDGEEDNIEDIVIVANDLCSSMIQTTLNIDFEEDINTKSHELISFGKSILIKEHGIVSQCTPPYTPQHNGVSERRNRSLLNMVRFMMSQTTLPMSFWDYALESAACILNMVPIKKFEKPPYEHTREVDFLDKYVIENTLAAYPIDYIPKAKIPSKLSSHIDVFRTDPLIEFTFFSYQIDDLEKLMEIIKQAARENAMLIYALADENMGA